MKVAQQQIAHQHAAPVAFPPAPSPHHDGDTKKGAWTEEEDSALRHYIEVKKRERKKTREREGRGREGRDSERREEKAQLYSVPSKKTKTGLWPAQLDADLCWDQREVGKILQAPLVQPGKGGEEGEGKREKAPPPTTKKNIQRSF